MHSYIAAADSMTQLSAQCPAGATSAGGSAMSEAEKRFWAEAGVRPEDAKDMMADRPSSAGGSSTGGGSLSGADQQAFWAEAGITPEELGIAPAGALKPGIFSAPNQCRLVIIV